jgi:hypothetical protein
MCIHRRHRDDVEPIVLERQPSRVRVLKRDIETCAARLAARDGQHIRGNVEHAFEYKHIYRALVGGRGGVIAVNEIRRALSEIVKKELSSAQEDEAVPQEVRTQFVVGTLLTMLTWWLERRPMPAPSQADAMFRRLVLNGIGPSIRTAPRRR